MAGSKPTPLCWEELRRYNAEYRDSGKADTSKEDKGMGVFHAKVRIGNLHGGDTHETEALVDTGATDSAFPSALLEQLHITPNGEPPVVYITADGGSVTCQRGQAAFTIDMDDETSISGICPVAFWPDDSGQCIGATTLQVMMLAVDAPNERLMRVSTARRGWPGSIV